MRNHEHEVHQRSLRGQEDYIQKQDARMKSLEDFLEVQRLEWRTALVEKDERIQSLEKQVRLV